ncbi:MAG: hypothetical protein ACR2JF_07785 [Iamia sp.]
MPGSPAARSASRASAALGGLLLLVATAMPWSGRGAGSSIALHRVGDLILSGAVDAWASRWIGLVVYAVPLSGALLLVGAGLGGRRGAALSAVAAAGGLAASGLVVDTLDRVGRSGTGPGTVLAVTGAALGVVAALLGVLGRSGPREHPIHPPGPADGRRHPSDA